MLQRLAWHHCAPVYFANACCSGLQGHTGLQPSGCQDVRLPLSFYNAGAAGTWPDKGKLLLIASLVHIYIRQLSTPPHPVQPL